jgi:hypothetical protein
MAVLTVECETATPDRLVIHVKTLADTLNTASPVDRVFSDRSAAIAYLDAWLEAWSLSRITAIDVEPWWGDAPRDE